MRECVCVCVCACVHVIVCVCVCVCVCVTCPPPGGCSSIGCRAVTAPPLCATSHCRRKSCPTGSGAHTRPPSATTPRPGRWTGNTHTHTHTQRQSRAHMHTRAHTHNNTLSYTHTHKGC